MWRVIRASRQSGEVRQRLLSLAVAAIILCAFFIAPSSAAGYVKVAEFLASSPRPRITVVFEGKPLADSKVEIYRQSKKAERPRYTLVTDRSGLAVLPTLRSGKYRIFASAAPRLSGDLYLEASSATSDAASQFTINLEPLPFPSQESVLAAAEREPIKDVLRTFNGIVGDPIGYPIPGASIDVVRKGTEGKVHAAPVLSDAQGRFAVRLADGDYVAFFRASGFSERVLSFTVSKANGSGELQVRLNIAPSS